MPKSNSYGLSHRFFRCAKAMREKEGFQVNNKENQYHRARNAHIPGKPGTVFSPFSHLILHCSCFTVTYRKKQSVKYMDDKTGKKHIFDRPNDNISCQRLR